MDKSLNELRDEATRIAEEHGFKDASIPEDIALMHSELSEALEDFREGRLAHEMEYEDAVGSRFKNLEEAHRLSHHRDSTRGFKPVGIPSEMADVMIRVLHFCGKHGIDIEKAVEEKMAYNASRPFKHGGKKI